jgi:hypothetical protein
VALLSLAAAALVAGCGGSDQLSKGDTNALAEVPTLHNRTVASVLRESAASMLPYWPDLAAQLQAAAKK